ncbi:MAG TPA: endonuclease/exonuclease/phosphatase family protein [Thermomicrobiales bacterium]|nr:endonuclease/exonuclease/phosphatase family protein [Thermomicrobiales bacterium]
MGQAREIRVGTLNLRNTSDRWSERRGLLFDQLSTLKPDLLGVQELRRPSSQACQLIRQANARRERPHYRLYTAWKTGLRRFWEGIGVLTELPVVDLERIDLGSGDRVAQRVTVALDDGALLDFYNTHLSHDESAADERLAQVEVILRAMRGRPNRPCVLVGDLNATPDEPAISRLGEELRSAYAHVHGREPDVTAPSPLSATWGSEPKVIDYIFASDRIDVVDAWVTFDATATGDPRLTASDHYGLAATLSVAWPHRT